MELRMYKMLEKAEIPFEYIGKENAKYELMRPFVYEGGCFERAQKRSKQMRDNNNVNGIGYTPDFVAPDESWFIEVKGRKLGDFSIRWKLFKQVLSERDPQPLLFMPTNIQDCEQVINILKSEINAKREN